jgi:hypothetical protein
VANQTDIDAVKAQLPDEAPTEFGFDDTLIGAMLDGGQTISQSILTGWRAIAAKTALYTDVNESGSSRNLSALNANAREMVTVWQTQVDKEMNAAGTELVRRFTSHTAVRI